MDSTGSNGAGAHAHTNGATPSGMSALRSLAIDHTTAPLELLERMAFSEEQVLGLYHELRRLHVEAVVVSTCNRTEIHWASRGAAADERVEALFLGAGAAPAPPRDHFRARSGLVSAEHLFRLAAGLESAVVGESEILGQVRGAIDLADRVGTSGFFLAALFRAALRFGGLARQETGIGAGAMSVVSASLALLGPVYSDLSRCTALVVGAGATGRSAACLLRAENVGRLVILNRTTERALALAGELQSEGGALAELEQRLPSADIVVVAVRAERPVVTAAMARAIEPTEPGRPRVWLDLSLPRGVEPSCAHAHGVHLHDLSALQEIVERNHARRLREIPRVETLLARELKVFETQSRESSLRPVLTELWRMAENVRRAEIERAVRDGVPEGEMLDHVTRRIVDRLLHGPSMALRRGDLALDGQHAHYVRQMFGLDGDTNGNGAPHGAPHAAGPHAEEARRASA